MAYRKLSIDRPRPTLDISGKQYDIDYFGMDDGKSDEPDTALRFVFGLGHELMIHRYVIQAGGASDVTHFAHSFWLEDCAVAYVDREDLGPPESVAAPRVVLPLLYDSVMVWSARAERCFGVRAQTFRARKPPSAEQEIEMAFELCRGDAAAGRLIWSRRDAWLLEQQDGSTRALEQGEWVRFASSGRPRGPARREGA